MLTRLDMWEVRLGRVAYAVALLGLAVLVLIAAITVVDVLGRWLANAPIQGGRDVSQVAIVVVVAACFPAAVLSRQHITIRFIGEWLGPRVNAWLDAFGAIVLFATLAVIAWQFVVYTGELIEENQKTWILELHYWPWWIVGASLFVVTAGLQFLVTIVQIARAVVGWAPPADDGTPKGYEV